MNFGVFIATFGFVKFTFQLRSYFQKEKQYKNTLIHSIFTAIRGETDQRSKLSLS